MLTCHEYNVDYMMYIQFYFLELLSRSLVINVSHNAIHLSYNLFP